ncbi:MAG: hypothetical protein PGN07_09250 [Aeromicrobium erythreum]
MVSTSEPGTIFFTVLSAIGMRWPVGDTSYVAEPSVPAQVAVVLASMPCTPLPLPSV